MISDISGFLATFFLFVAIKKKRRKEDKKGRRKEGGRGKRKEIRKDRVKEGRRLKS